MAHNYSADLCVGCACLAVGRGEEIIQRQMQETGPSGPGATRTQVSPDQLYCIAEGMQSKATGKRFYDQPFAKDLAVSSVKM